MGTSKTYPGPSNRNPLIPPWPEDEAPSDEMLVTQPEPWGPLKRAMKELASSPTTSARDSRKVRDVVRGFVGALGGPGGGASGARAGRQTAANIGKFFAAVANSGAVQAVGDLGLAEFLDRPAIELLSALGNVLAPSGALAEDAAARDAFHETMAELLEEAELTATGREVLEAVTLDSFRTLLERYVANWVIARLLQTLSAAVEEGATSPTRAVAVEQQVRDYVRHVVRLDRDLAVTDPTTWSGAAGGRSAQRIFVMALRVLEAAL